MWSEQRQQADLYPPDESALWASWLSGQHSELSTGKQNSLCFAWGEDVSRLHLLPRLGCKSERMSNKKTGMALRAVHTNSHESAKADAPAGPSGLRCTYPMGAAGGSAGCVLRAAVDVSSRSRPGADEPRVPALPRAASPSAGKSPVPAVWIPSPPPTHT